MRLRDNHRFGLLRAGLGAALAAAVALAVALPLSLGSSPAARRVDVARAGASRSPSTTVGATTTVPPSTSTTSRPGTSQPGAVPSPGFWIDSPDGTPHYVLSVAEGPGGLTGWLFFLYQDGHTSMIFHYSATISSAGSIEITTDSTSQPFPYVGRGSPPFPDPINAPIPPGRHLQATYANGTITLDGCASYLYAASSHIYPPSSCTFSYNGSMV